MNVIKTASNGAVNEQTIFDFKQNGNVVSAKYSGGGVNRGFLVGRVENNSLSFKYAQQHTDKNIYGGYSNCEIIYEEDSIIELIESFEWSAGVGKNIFRILNCYYTQEGIGRLVCQFEDHSFSSFGNTW